ncbi:GNAT family N-acetyltransferase [Sphingomonas sp. HDW15A]|uniref:GNAT family N-acetyltransferase n=1 Tax=Sphingomonas sp. HDW15A TaxID=2714942 RepID=UPI00140C7CDB|nr:GNAT family N-acetyltransferase [Sphingomonas sp. HDW15A]QIK95251.1 GNAT family N-acetyltransferase [Sphingomonas sp. HDW15A]
MIIRAAKKEEHEALEEIQRRASLALEDYRTDLEANPDAIAIPEAQIERGDVIVAELDGRLAGFAALDGSELDGLFVNPEHWRRGIGAALVDAAIHEARRRGLSLVTVVANPTARSFYEKCGFRMEGQAQTRFGPAIKMSR